MKAKHTAAFVLLSGGIDSTTALYRAANDYQNVTAVSIDYGQRHKREIEHAKRLAARCSAGHVTLQVPSVLEGDHVMLTDAAVEVPDTSYDQIKGISPTYVPFRNGTMLAVVAAHAMKYVSWVQRTEVLDPNSPVLKDLVAIYFGAHAEDARGWAYPDCTPEFVGAMANAIYVGSYQTVRLVTPFIHNTKAEIIDMGAKMGVPYKDTWSCYVGGEVHCGVCPTCRARKDAFYHAGIHDPTIYAA